MRSDLRLLVAAVVVMLVGVVAAVAILLGASRALVHANATIVDNAAPSVVVLDDAQARVGQLHTLVLTRGLSAGSLAVRDASIAATRRDLERDIKEYLALPTDPGE